MKRTSIKIGFTHYRDGALSPKARKIIVGMTGNAHFPNPEPSIQDIQQQNAEFEASMDAMNGSPLNTSLKNKARKALVGSLKMLGRYVLQHADGDEAILMTTGFDLTTTRQNRRILAAPEGFKVVNGNLDGSMELSCDKVDGARAYLFQYTEAPLTGDSIWEMESSTVPLHLLEDLVEHKAYGFRVGVVGKGKKPVFSQVIVKYVN